MARVAPRLRAFAMSLTRDPHDGDDLSQTTLLFIWRSRDTFQAGTDFSAWAFRILRNANISRIRNHRLRGEKIAIDEVQLTAPDDQHAIIESRQLRTAIERLPGPMREAITLVALSGLTYEDAAKRVGCAVGTLKSRVFRARAVLARLS